MSDEIPRFSDLFQPLLNSIRSLGGSATPNEVRTRLAEDLGLTDEQLEMTTEGDRNVFGNRVAWARLYLVKSGYLESSKRGVWSLTDKGNESSLSSHDESAIVRSVRDDFRSKRAAKKAVVLDDDFNDDSDDDYRTRVRTILGTMPPEGFERLCQRLLRESGFEQVAVTGRSGDGGIDGHGVLQLNPFVSFRTLFQCKRYAGTVSSSVVRDFRGAMMGRADKGIIITTGTFSRDARREASRDGVPPIELVDGEALLDLLESLELGLHPVKTFEVDEDFFNEFN